MKNSERFPDDENGDVLRRMYESGDDLSMPRDVDFTVVLPGEATAKTFRDYFSAAGYQVRMDNTCTVAELPWDVVVVKRMRPEHAEITAFERELEAMAEPLGGRNDGWGCFEQPGNSH